ncbi:MAG: transcriptional regulator, AraC family [Sphingomonas bacterium]|nr:transcriptional regulator, AraC family [Sphingomonas bacterium]MDB5717861.1 transcriptional regulator, AraC family [Sphingomonas bacterium]
MQRYSTRDVPAGCKVGYWNDVTSSVFAPMEAKSLDRDGFEAELDCARLGSSWLANVRSTPAIVHRNPGHVVKTRDRPYFLHLQLKGRLKVVQDGRDAMLDPGDLVLTDSAMPYSLRYEEDCSTLVMILTAGDLANRLPAPDDLLGVKLSGRDGMAGTASSLLAGLWEEARTREMTDTMGDTLASAVLDVFAASWIATANVQVAESAVSISRRIQIRRHVEAHLRDPDLSARSVAAAFGISPRYLHIIFSTGEETVSNLILRRRLEECAKQLRDPIWARRTITEIAFSWGFNNATHFARVFREKYGLSPRDYRTAQLSS